MINGNQQNQADFGKSPLHRGIFYAIIQML